ncbi:hypothetical protein L0Z65_02400 [Phaeobacter sp. BS52]|uniref:hypothetical protein n=1 Tax=Phaeobacter sp. BS52 TaxID=2907241 RepID=UPI0038638127
MDFAAHQLTDVAGDALTQGALQLLTHDFRNQLTQRVLIQKALIGAKSVQRLKCGFGD